MDYNVMPSTPIRYNGNLDFTSTQDMELYNLSERSSAFLVSPPSQQLDGNALNYELASIWSPYTDDSPITFATPGIQIATPSESSPYSMRRNRESLVINGPQIRSAILHQHTMDGLVEEQHTLGQMTEENIEQARYQFAYSRRVNKGKYKCDILNCPKRYTRAEHLKRHKNG